MKKHLELLAPGGDIDSIKAAIAAGADAIYCGLDKFNARNRATNIVFDDLHGIIKLAHSHQCKIFLTLNIIIVESELPALIALLNRLQQTSIDGIIVQDLGLLYIISHYYKGLSIHASTQLTTHNEGQLLFLNKLQASRVNLSRELNIEEIKALTVVAHAQNMLTEVFVHGSSCLCFSGICYMSSVYNGNSGNRGRCSQPCRDSYKTTAVGKDFPLNLKDNSAFTNLADLYNAGVDSLKIEGRIKKSHYVYTVVDAWRNHLQRFYSEGLPDYDTNALYKVFNRGFTNGFLTGIISKDMFIDNPRDNSAIHLSETKGDASIASIESAKAEIYDERTEIIQSVEQKLANLSIAKTPLIVSFSGECGKRLTVTLKTSESIFIAESTMVLEQFGAQTLDLELCKARFKAIHDTGYVIDRFDLENLQPGLFIPFKELTVLKKKILLHLTDLKEYVEPITLALLPKSQSNTAKPQLSILISSDNDVMLYKNQAATVYFELPNCFANEIDYFIDLFTIHNDLIPWFPSILIGEDYNAAVLLLNQIRPHRIVTNNTGIAFEAYRLGIRWIAGPYLNIVNSYSLLCLKEQFNCSGAFISNELHKIQIRSIKKPDDFDLFYSIFHPIVLMTSRQCLFHQVDGCSKNEMDNSCIKQCEKSTSITNSKHDMFLIKKSKGNYHTIYNDTHFLNTEILKDIPQIFTGFLIDVRPIHTKTNIEVDSLHCIKLFDDLLENKEDSINNIEQCIHPTTMYQYQKGI